jgi:hypothetical protein
VARRLTDTLESFTIAQAAKLWARDSGEQADLIERKLISAAEKGSSNPNLETVRSLICFEPLHASYQALPPEEREREMRSSEKRLYTEIDGLYVNHRGEPITRLTPVSRIALEAWCEQEGFELPQFLKPTAAEFGARVRAWLRHRIKSVEQQLEVRQAKGAYRAAAINEFGPELSKRAFDRLWDNTVPDAWRRGGRPKKPNHS